MSDTPYPTPRFEPRPRTASHASASPRATARLASELDTIDARSGSMQEHTFWQTITTQVLAFVAKVRAGLDAAPR